ncbi:hypothetical protein AaE_001290 [Aphanomyces astaci]|uniref:Kinesin motor domain-containing protein n=1 Tax=Aphanomyces astaci TaxID=112090 RepID=A0A6A5AXL8_APHAT|nr:hypothetical protein AaE_001290 [Aphanomyces astaci]
MSDADTSTLYTLQVAVRIRPISQAEQLNGHRSCCRVAGDQTVVIEKPGIPLRHLKSQRGFTNEYAYDIAFPDYASQGDVYTKTVRNIIPTILKGFNATIFAYVLGILFLDHHVTYM